MELEGQFDEFWNRWESRKRQKLLELRASCARMANAEIKSIATRMEEACEDKKSHLAVKVGEARQMQKDLWEGFHSWCGELSTLVENVRRDEIAVRGSVQKAESRLKRGREEMEQKQQEEVAKFHARCVKILSESGKAVENIYVHPKSTNSSF